MVWSRYENGMMASHGIAQHGITILHIYRTIPHSTVALYRSQTVPPCHNAQHHVSLRVISYYSFYRIISHHIRGSWQRIHLNVVVCLRLLQRCVSHRSILGFELGPVCDKHLQSLLSAPRPQPSALASPCCLSLHAPFGGDGGNTETSVRQGNATSRSAQGPMGGRVEKWSWRGYVGGWVCVGWSVRGNWGGGETGRVGAGGG